MTKVKIEKTISNEEVGLYELNEKDFFECAEELFLKLSDSGDGVIPCVCLTKRNFINFERYTQVRLVSNIEIYYNL